MAANNPDNPLQADSRMRALSRWDNEGGADPVETEIAADGRGAPTGSGQNRSVEVNYSEWTELRIRVIALENLVISLLATASAEQILLAGEMASYISPRPGFTQHPLTVRAADGMRDLVERSENFRRDAS
jgi:hypothetical protein